MVYLAACVPARYGFARPADRVPNPDLVLGAALLATAIIAEAYSVGTAMRILIPVMLVLALLVAAVGVRSGAAA